MSPSEAWLYSSRIRWPTSCAGTYGDEHRHVSITLHAAEALDSLQNAGGDPPQHHLPAAPPLNVALHVSRATEETLGGSARRGAYSARTPNLGSIGTVMSCGAWASGDPRRAGPRPASCERVESGECAHFA
jgi:hypothetical protein